MLVIRTKVKLETNFDCIATGKVIGDIWLLMSYYVT